MKRLKLRAQLAVAAETPKRFTILAYTGGKLNVEGFEVPVVVDLNGLEATGNIPIAIKHNTKSGMILGQTDTKGAMNDGRRLVLTGDITADLELSPAAKRIVQMARNGHKWQASIGADLEETVDIEAGETVEVNGQSLTGPFVLAMRSVLRETSVLAMGADKNTKVLLAQARGVTMSFEEWLASLGFGDPSTLTEEAKAVLMQQYNATQSVDAEGEEEDLEAEDCTDGEDHVEAEGDTESEDRIEAEDGTDPEKKVEAGAKKPALRAKKTARKTVTASQKKTVQAGKTVKAGKKPVPVTASARIMADRLALVAESRRVERIQAQCAKDPKLMRRAIQAGWSVDKAELEMMRRDQHRHVPAGHRREGGSSGMLQTLQAAMILRAGGKLDHKCFTGLTAKAMGLPQWLRANLNSEQRQRVMDAAFDFSEMSMVDVCREACRIEGREPTQKGHKGYIEAAMSGSSVQSIFTTSINAVFLQKFEEAEDTTQGWVDERDGKNFLPMETGRLTKGEGLTEHSPGGTADSTERSAEMETYKISRFSRKYELDEMDIINDTFNVLADIPDEMSLACSRMRPDLVYSVIMSNPNLQATGAALFSESQQGGQSNLKASGGGLDAATLQAAIAAIWLQMENNVALNLHPDHLLVAPSKVGLAFNLLQGINIALAGTAGSVTQLGDVNPLNAIQQAFGRIKVVSDARLENGVIDPKTKVVYPGSATTWRLVCSKARPIQVAYLVGSGRAPQVRQYNLDRGQWGIGWDVKYDIGAKGLGWRGLYESRQ